MALGLVVKILYVTYISLCKKYDPLDEATFGSWGIVFDNGELNTKLFFQNDRTKEGNPNYFSNNQER